MYNVMFVDDNIGLLKAYKMLAQTSDKFRQVITISQPLDLLDYDFSEIDCIFLDIRMPELTGFELAEKLKAKNLKIIILSTFYEPEFIALSFANNITGYLLKNATIEDFENAVTLVMNDQNVYAPEVANEIAKMISKKELDLEMNPRTMQILKLLANGYSNREIAEYVFLSEGTVKNVVSKLLVEYNCRDRTQLAIYYLKNLTNKKQ
ncbi:MAG: response regulator transcription factor [Mycoplasmatales bacterium]